MTVPKPSHPAAPSQARAVRMRPMLIRWYESLDEGIVPVYPGAEQEDLGPLVGVTMANKAELAVMGDILVAWVERAENWRQAN